jgi:putative ABC transport system substrate-binding protein
VALLAAALAAAGAPAAPRRVVVLQGTDAEAYRLAAQGVAAAFGAGSGVVLESKSAAGAALDRALDALAADPPAVVVALGSDVAERAAARLPGVPLVAGMVLHPRVVAAHPNAATVSIDFPVETELAWLQRILPGHRHVGVLYDPAHSAEKIDAARAVAAQRGIELIAVEVASPRALPDALRRLAREADSLWGIADPTVFSAETAKTVLLFSYRNRIPFAGISDHWVKAGALYALERDYVDIGRQCGELAQEVLAGKRAGDLSVSHPRTVRYALNLKAARHLKQELPSDLVAGAGEVFE